MNSTVVFELLWTSTQHLLFSNSTSISFKGSVLSSGFMYTMPFLTIVCLGVNDAMFGFSIVDIMPVPPGNMRILLLTVIGIDVCCMYNLCVA